MWTTSSVVVNLFIMRWTYIAMLLLWTYLLCCESLLGSICGICDDPVNLQVNTTMLKEVDNKFYFLFIFTSTIATF